MPSSRSLAALLVVLSVAIAGCVAPADAPLETTEGPAADSATTPPSMLEWSGFVLTSTGEGLSHTRPSEDVLWPVQKQGFLAEIAEGTTELEVSLSWDGPGEMMIMLHSHKEHGTNVYVEHITEMDAENPKCLRVPAADVAPGTWQVMVHSRGARQTAFTLDVLTVGGEAKLVENDRHGHWPQDGGFEVDEHEIEPCRHGGAAAS